LGQALRPVQLVSARTGRLGRALPPWSEGNDPCLAFSPDGIHLAVGYEELKGQNAEFGVWDVRDGGLRWRRTAGGMRGRDPIAVSPDGRLLATGGERSRLWDSASGELRRELWLPEGESRHLAGFTANSIVFSPDGGLLAGGGVVSGGGGRLYVWDSA